MFSFLCLCGRVESSSRSDSLETENAQVAQNVDKKKVKSLSMLKEEDDSEIGGSKIDDDEIVLWFGEKQISLSSRDSKRLSLQDCRNILGICKSHRIRAEGGFKELPDESLVCDLIKENRTRFNSSPRTDQNSICMICQEAFKEEDSICTSHQCGHQLHSHCAAQAFQFSTRCPCCRKQWKTYDEYCPKIGLLQKHNSFERELHVEDPLNEFVPNELLNAPVDNSEISESPLSFSAHPPRRRFLPRSFGESRIMVNRRDPARSTRVDSLRNLGRTFVFSESLLDVIDASPSMEEEVASPVSVNRNNFVDSDSEDDDHVDSDSEELSVSREICEPDDHDGENIQACPICNQQECGVCTHCMQNSRNFVE